MVGNKYFFSGALSVPASRSTAGILLVSDERNSCSPMVPIFRFWEAFYAFPQAVNRRYVPCKHRSFDLVIADYVMPAMNGFRLFDKYESIQPFDNKLIFSENVKTNVLVKALKFDGISRMTQNHWHNDGFINEVERLLYSKNVCS